MCDETIRFYIILAAAGILPALLTTLSVMVSVSRYRDCMALYKIGVKERDDNVLRPVAIMTNEEIWVKALEESHYYNGDLVLGNALACLAILFSLIFGYAQWDHAVVTMGSLLVISAVAGPTVGRKSVRNGKITFCLDMMVLIIIALDFVVLVPYVLDKDTVLVTATKHVLNEEKAVGATVLAAPRTRTRILFPSFRKPYMFAAEEPVALVGQVVVASPKRAVTFGPLHEENPLRGEGKGVMGYARCVSVRYKIRVTDPAVWYGMTEKERCSVGRAQEDRFDVVLQDIVREVDLYKLGKEEGGLDIPKMESVLFPYASRLFAIEGVGGAIELARDSVTLSVDALDAGPSLRGVYCWQSITRSTYPSFRFSRGPQR